MAQVVAEYEKFEIDNQLLMEALKGGALGAGAVFATDFIASKFLHNGKIRAIVCAIAPIALSMWLKDKNPELAKGIAVGGAGAGIYKIIQAFLYQRLNIPYAAAEYDYGIIEEVPVEEPMPEMASYSGVENYGVIEEVPVEEPMPEVEAAPTYGTSLA